MGDCLRLPEVWLISFMQLYLYYEFDILHADRHFRYVHKRQSEYIRCIFFNTARDNPVVQGGSTDEVGTCML